MTFSVSSESLTPRGDRSCHWSAGETLFVADLHFGKAEYFRKAGIPTPGLPATRTLEKLTLAIEQTQSKTLVILGDFWHAKSGRTNEVIDAISKWRLLNPQLEIHLILGNHDRFSQGDHLPDDWRFITHAAGTNIGPFVASHYPDPSPLGYVLAGHIHPSIKIRGRGRQSLSLPCFWFGATVGVLPAFGGYTGTANIQPTPHDTIFAIADGEIVKLPSYTA